MWAEPNDDVIPQPDCPMCQNPDRRFIVGTWEDPIGVARCTACGLVHATGRNATVLPVQASIGGDDRRRHRQTFALYDRLLHGRLSAPAQGAKALDIGCGAGGWLDQMRLWGYATEGTDTDPTPAAGRHPIFDVDCTEAGADLDRAYDVITLIDVLQLLDRPVAALHFATRHLAPGGVVIIEVPNWNHGRTRSRIPSGIQLGQQVAFYDRDSLRDAVMAVGLEPLAVWSAPGVLDRAISTTRTQLRRTGSPGFLRRTLALAERALTHASDASDQGATLVVVAHRELLDAH